MNNKDIPTQIIKLFAKSPFSTFNPKQIAASVGARDKASRKEVMDTLIQMVEDHILILDDRSHYRLDPSYVNDDLMPQNYVIGTIDMKPSGKAFVIPQDENLDDIEVAANNTNHALHGDTVKVRLFPQRYMRQSEGQVVEILQRARTRFVGVIQRQQRFAFMVSSSRTMVTDIFIPLSDLADAQDGEKVLVEMTDWPERMNNPVGKVIKRLGRPGDNNVEMQSILAEFDFPLDFPKEAEREADKIKPPTEKDYEGRSDFRKVTTFTIDPADAKDYDDALSFKMLNNGNYQVGVHIADVSYYVKPGSAIDHEAYLRGTSVYLVDRTIPMLPERLCNGVCSLRPNEEKLCFSVVMEITPKGEVHKQWFGKTVILSDQRLSYEEAQAIIDNIDTPTDFSPVADAIRQLHRVAQMLRKQRYDKGAINFESQEVKFILDDNAKPIGVYIKEQKEANWLIEEFMLLANRLVAEHVGAKPKKEDGKDHSKKEIKTFVYRVHDEPNPEKLNTFIEFVAKLGFKMKVNSRRALAASYNNLFEKIAGRGEENMIDNIAIRTMSKAYYSTQNIGHYGLAFPFYTHFTSPIRRYPDLLVHRLLQRYLTGGKSVSSDEYEDYCKHCSLMERKATDAERSSVKYKQAEFLSDKIGQVFPALISGVSKWGFYAEIEGNKCEGMVPIGSLQDDYYMLDEDNYQIIGRRHGKCYKLGFPVKVRVKGVDMIKKQIDFELVDENENQRSQHKIKEGIQKKAKRQPAMSKKAKKDKKPTHTKKAKGK